MSLLVEGTVRMIMWHRTWHKTVRTVPLQRTVGGYRWHAGGHVIDVCLHRRTESQCVQRHEHMITDDEGQVMIRRKVTSSVPCHLVACLDCPTVACLDTDDDDHDDARSALDPRMSIYPVAVSDERTGPVRSGPGPVQSSPRSVRARGRRSGI